MSHLLTDEARGAAIDTVTNNVKSDQGMVGRRIFGDEDVYKLELERVFGRSWLFLAHETQVEKPGDFIVTKMGETPVIVWRDAKSEIRAFINSCRHRGNPVVRADEGNAMTFTCSYHGWCYNVAGRRAEPGGLISLPGMENYYHEKLEKEKWGLIPVAQVSSYKGLVFGTLDAEAPSLEDYLGDMRWSLDMLLDKGDLAAVPGIARWQIDCNWKFAADNAIGDNAHAQVTHRSALKLFAKQDGFEEPPVGVELPGITMATQFGHGMNCEFQFVHASGQEKWRCDAELKKKLGGLRWKIERYNMNVFPNLFVIGKLLMLRNPVGPGKTEIRGLALYDRNEEEEVRNFERRSAFSIFGPAGLLEQDDGENWDQSTEGCSYPANMGVDLNYAMGLGDYELIDDGENPPYIESSTNEYGQRAFYEAWADAMRSSSWEELKSKPALLERIK